jgi:hypothetical protein
MQTITLLVAGPVASRLNTSFSFRDLENSFEVFRRACPDGKIILSTYEGEFPPSLTSLVDGVVINEDPGPDYFQPNPWPISKRGGQANYKRLLNSTLRGLESCQNGYVVKTRVELLPRQIDFFSEWLKQVTTDLEANSSLKVGFFLEHYSGISFSINGLLGGIPDTLQIGRRSDLLRVWETASIFWENNSYILTRKSKRFPITSEQLIGMSFLQVFYGFDMRKNLRKLDRYFRNLELLSVIVKSEKESFRWSSYKNSGFESEYLKKSFSLDLTKFSIPNTSWDLIKKLAIVQAKMIFHHYRRYFVGLKSVVGTNKSRV